MGGAIFCAGVVSRTTGSVLLCSALCGPNGVTCAAHADQAAGFDMTPAAESDITPATVYPDPDDKPYEWIGERL